MKFNFDHDYHIHSYLSNCSNDPNQNPKTILEYAKQNNLSELCITDHFWDENVDGASDWYSAHHKFAQISKIRPLPQVDGIKFYFGAETELDKNCKLGISKSRFDEFDFVIIPTTHLHMKGFTISEEDYNNPKIVAKLWTKRALAVLDMDLPFHKIGLAHLACDIMCHPVEKVFETIDLIPVDDMYKVFKKAKELGVGIELNGGDMLHYNQAKDTILKPFKIAKDCKCKFYIRSDSHHPERFGPLTENFTKAIDDLGLEESDRFFIK
jgi:histidinol phosphatase-like PHP family hydrolase